MKTGDKYTYKGLTPEWYNQTFEVEQVDINHGRATLRRIDGERNAVCVGSMELEHFWDKVNSLGRV